MPLLPTTSPRRALRAVLAANTMVALLLGAVAGRSVATAGAPPVHAPVVAPRQATEASPGPGAYWLVASDGGIFSFGGVPFRGSAGATPLIAPIVAMAPTPTGRGYWLAAADGGIFAFGDAPYAGSPAAGSGVAHPSTPVVAISSTPDGGGYWVTTAAGGVYAFGDATFLGSLGGLRLAAPIVGMAPTPDGGGYWLAAADGGVFNFGDAGFAGSAGAVRLVKPIVGMAATTDGGGYWLVAADGGIFGFGAAAFHGSTGAIRLNQPIVGMAATPTGRGYWLVASDGGIFSFGDAAFRGSTGGRKLNRPITGLAVGHTLDPYPPGGQGYDISFPQCGGAFPAQPFAFGVVGVNDGRAFTHNPCLADQRSWAGTVGSVYINLNAPPHGSTEGLDGPAGRCVGNDTGCIAYNYGFNAAVDAFVHGTGAGVVSGVWWLDIETANAWDTNTFNNDRTIQGALDALGTEGVVAGIYSTHHQWGLIAGGFAPRTPIWKATAADLTTAQAACADDGPYYLNFAGGTPWLTQYGSPASPYDQDYACP